MSSETALAIQFLNGNLGTVARHAARDGGLAVGIALELLRLGARSDVERFRTCLDAARKDTSRSRKAVLRQDPDQTP